MKKYKLNRKFFSVLLAGALVNTPAKAFAETVQADTEVPDGIEMTYDGIEAMPVPEPDSIGTTPLAHCPDCGEDYPVNKVLVGEELIQTINKEYDFTNREEAENFLGQLNEKAEGLKAFYEKFQSYRFEYNNQLLIGIAELPTIEYFNSEAEANEYVSTLENAENVQIEKVLIDNLSINQTFTNGNECVDYIESLINEGYNIDNLLVNNHNINITDEGIEIAVPVGQEIYEVAGYIQKDAESLYRVTWHEASYKVEESGSLYKLNYEIEKHICSSIKDEEQTNTDDTLNNEETVIPEYEETKEDPTVNSEPLEVSEALPEPKENITLPQTGDSSIKFKFISLVALGLATVSTISLYAVNKLAEKSKTLIKK